MHSLLNLFHIIRAKIMRWTRNPACVAQMKDVCKGEGLVYKSVNLKGRRNVIIIAEAGCKLDITGSG
jgi:hypothetical protein